MVCRTWIKLVELRTHIRARSQPYPGIPSIPCQQDILTGLVFAFARASKTAYKFLPRVNKLICCQRLALLLQTYVIDGRRNMCMKRSVIWWCNLWSLDGSHTQPCTMHPSVIDRQHLLFVSLWCRRFLGRLGLACWLHASLSDCAEATRCVMTGGGSCLLWARAEVQI